MEYKFVINLIILLKFPTLLGVRDIELSIAFQPLKRLGEME